MRREGHAVRHRLGFAHAAPPRHEQEETEVEQGAHLRDTLTHRRGRLHTEVSQHDEVHHDAPKVEVSDVCGAGDTFLAALTYKYLETQDMNQAITFAIKASSITVQHVGVYAPTLEEIK